MKRFLAIAGGLLAACLVFLAWTLGPQLVNMKSEYVTAGVIRAVCAYVRTTQGQWPRSWSDLGGDCSAYTRVNFELDPTAAPQRDVMAAIAPRSGRYYTYPHAETDLLQIWCELKRLREKWSRQEGQDDAPATRSDDRAGATGTLPSETQRQGGPNS